jgi:protein-disulfide isomerase
MPLHPPISNKDHTEGNENAVIELVEYGDYQCPYCGAAYPIVKRIQEKLGDKLKFVFRNFPLSNIHPHAMEAAIATESAALQGKFWQMHDIVFENQNKLNRSSLLKYAKDVELDIDKFTIDITRPELQKKVEEDFESGIRSGVNGTPTFFINGEKYNGSLEEEDMLDFIIRKYNNLLKI